MSYFAHLGSGISIHSCVLNWLKPLLPIISHFYVKYDSRLPTLLRGLRLPQISSVRPWSSTFHHVYHLVLLVPSCFLSHWTIIFMQMTEFFSLFLILSIHLIIKLMSLTFRTLYNTSLVSVVLAIFELTMEIYLGN